MLTTIAGIAIEVSWFVVKTAGGLLYSAVWSTNTSEQSQEDKELQRLENLAVTNTESLRRIEQEMSLLRQALADSKKDEHHVIGAQRPVHNEGEPPVEEPQKRTEKD